MMKIIIIIFIGLKKLKKYVIKKETYSKAKLFILKNYVDNILSKQDEKIELKEHEKFKINDITYEVDVRGERDNKKKYYRCIDNENLSKAEVDIKSISTVHRKLDYKNYKELIVATKDDLNKYIKKRLCSTY